MYNTITPAKTSKQSNRIVSTCGDIGCLFRRDTYLKYIGDAAGIRSFLNKYNFTKISSILEIAAGRTRPTRSEYVRIGAV